MTTDVDTRFEWHDTDAGRVLVCRPLQTFAPHVFTTRALRFRGDTIAPDRAALGRSLGIPADDLFGVAQVHGCHVVIAAAASDVARVEADALVVTAVGKAASVLVADCVPMLMADRRGRAVAAVHAGWRGTAAGIGRATIERLKALDIPARDLTVAIGPSVGACCYQVDQPVHEAFTRTQDDGMPWFTADGEARWRLDLWRANRDQLVRAGVPDASIFTAGLCTAHHPGWFWSYRRDGAGTGRLAAAIVLRDPPGA